MSGNSSTVGGVSMESQGCSSAQVAVCRVSLHVLLVPSSLQFLWFPLTFPKHGSVCTWFTALDWIVTESTVTLTRIKKLFNVIPSSSVSLENDE